MQAGGGEKRGIMRGGKRRDDVRPSVVEDLHVF
jgi:hypothetical protein